MVTFILIIGVVNLGLGFALEAWLQSARLRPTRPASAPQPAESIQPEPPPEPLEEPPGEPCDESPLDQFEPEPVIETIPRQWLEILENEMIEVNSFVEASIQVLRLEVGKYRNRLVEIEDQLRAAIDGGQSDRIPELAEEIVRVNDRWMNEQSSAAAHLQERGDSLGEFEAVGNELQELLNDQSSGIRTANENLAGLDFESGAESAGPNIGLQLCGLLDHTHALRDAMEDVLMTILRAEDRVADLEPVYQVDNLTGLPNRSGVEVLFHDWRRADAKNQRLLSAAWCDLDRFGRLNEQFGHRIGDRVLGAVGQMLSDIVSDEDDGFLRMTRIGGESFLMFIGDVGPRKATATAEKLRQTIEAASFRIGTVEVDLTLSCGVIEVSSEMPLPDTLRKLRETMREAHTNGRNCTCTDEGSGPKCVADPPKYQVAIRSLEIPIS